MMDPITNAYNVHVNEIMLNGIDMSGTGGINRSEWEYRVWVEFQTTQLAGTSTPRFGSGGKC